MIEGACVATHRFANPFIGSLSDRLPERWAKYLGRRRPFVLAGAGMMALGGECPWARAATRTLVAVLLSAVLPSLSKMSIACHTVWMTYFSIYIMPHGRDADLVLLASLFMGNIGSCAPLRQQPLLVQSTQFFAQRGGPCSYRHLAHPLRCHRRGDHPPGPAWDLHRDRDLGQRCVHPGRLGYRLPGRCSP